MGINNKNSYTLTKVKFIVDRSIKYPVGDGDHGAISPNHYRDNGVPYLRVQNLSYSGKLQNKGLTFIPEEIHKKNLKSKIVPNDILIAKTGATIGKLCLVPDTWEEYNTTSSVGKITLDTKKFSIKFILYYLQSIFIQDLIKKISYQKSAQPGFNIDDLVEFPVTQPMINEQKLIVRYLDKKTHQIDLLINNIKEKIKILKELRIKLINQCVTKGVDTNVEMKDTDVEWIGKIPKHWDIKKIKHISIVKRGSSPRPIEDLAYFDEQGEFSWVRISDVSASNKYLMKTRETLSELGSSLSTKRYPGDIFLSIAGSVGKPIITKIKCCIHDGFVWFENLKINVEFMYYVFLTDSCFKGLGKMGTQLNLNTETVGNVYIPLPNDHEQKKIIIEIKKRLKPIDRLIDLEKHRYQTIQEYRQTLISYMVTDKHRLTEDMI